MADNPFGPDAVVRQVEHVSASVPLVFLPSKQAIADVIREELTACGEDVAHFRFAEVTLRPRHGAVEVRWIGPGLSPGAAPTTWYLTTPRLGYRLALRPVPRPRGLPSDWDTSLRGSGGPLLAVDRAQLYVVGHPDLPRNVIADDDVLAGYDIAVDLRGRSGPT